MLEFISTALKTFVMSEQVCNFLSFCALIFLHTHLCMHGLFEHIYHVCVYTILCVVYGSMYLCKCLLVSTCLLNVYTSYLSISNLSLFHFHCGITHYSVCLYVYMWVCLSLWLCACIMRACCMYLLLCVLNISWGAPPISWSEN